MKGLAPHTLQVFEAVSKLDCIKSYLLVGGTALSLTVCTVQGMIIKILKFFLSSQCVSPPGHSYSFNPIDSFTKEVIKSGALPVP